MPKITREIKDKIDRWLQEKGLNEFGDPEGTMYAGGTPLFNERTGEMKDRYEHVLEKHPKLAEDRET